MPEAARGHSAPLFRKSFTLDQDVTTAHLHICGLGYHESYLNAHRIGDHVLDPAQTDYEARCLYVTHDVTTHLIRGENTLGVILGNGWFHQDIVWGREMSYGPPRLIAALHIQLADNSHLVVTTDTTWLCSRSHIIENNIHVGETCDARKERQDWAVPGFDTQKWRFFEKWISAEEVQPPGGRLEAQTIPPIKVIGTLSPRTVTEPQPGYHVVDMGQNFAGWARIRVSRACPGTCIRLRFAETLDAHGMLDTGSTGTFATGVEQIDTYICKGGGEETWEPRFTYHGFRYVEVIGWPGKLSPEEITGVVVHTALPEAGAFASSDSRLNRLHQMALWTHRSNIHGLPEDCPARERCGWLGDAHIICDFSLYNFQGDAFWRKYLDDIETSRAGNNGLPTMVAPGKRSCGTASPDWMAALILIPWTHYVFHGDAGILQKHWDGMKRVIEHFCSLSENALLPHGLGDWFDPGECAQPRFTPPVKTSTLLFGQCADIISRAANILGHADIARDYAGWSEKIRHAFTRSFFDPAQGTFGSQTADAMALQLGFVPPGREQAVADALAADIRARDMHMTTGIMGIKYLFEALTRHGHGDIALALMHQDTYPGFGDLIRKGATTLWEYWGEAEVDARHGPRSLNHPMMGGYDSWFFNTLAGIRPDSANPGFSHFHLEPHPIAGLAAVSAYHDCPYGRITSNWLLESGLFTWDVAVPENTTATARLPDNRIAILKPGRHAFTASLFDTLSN